MAELGQRERIERRRERERRGLERPGPVRTRVVNLASVSAGPEHVKRILRNAIAEEPEPVLVLAVECSDVTIANHLPPGWAALQLGRHLTDPGERIARSGSAIIYRRDVVSLDRVKLRVGSHEGEGIRTRFTLKARATFHRGTAAAWRTPVVVGHAPPARAPRGRAAFLAALDRLVGVKAGDFNLPAGVVRRVLGLRSRSVGVLHLTAPWWIPVSAVRGRDVGSDHRTVDVVLWPRRGRATR